MPANEDVVDLLTGLATTRAIRRYRDEPIPDDDLSTILWHATRAPSGSNRQPFRFVVLRDGPKAEQAKSLLGGSFRSMWARKREADGYDEGSGASADTPKARMAATMPCRPVVRRANLMAPSMASAPLLARKAWLR